MSSKLMHKWFLKEKQLILEKCKHLSRQVPHPTRASPEPTRAELEPTPPQLFSEVIRGITTPFQHFNPFTFRSDQKMNFSLQYPYIHKPKVDEKKIKNINERIVLH